MKQYWISWTILGTLAVTLWGRMSFVEHRRLLSIYNDANVEGSITTNGNTEEEELLLSLLQHDEASTSDVRSNDVPSSLTIPASNAAGFRFNTMAFLYGQDGDGTGRTADDPDLTKIGIRYQCEGDEYERFAALMRQGAQTLVEQGERPPRWGRRPAPLPPNSRVLIFGNSHARQVALALAGQGGAEMISEVHAFGFDKLMPSQIMAQRYRYTNNSTLYIVANSIVAHCPYPNWKFALEQQIEASLDSMDAIVLGLFNPGRMLRKHIESMLPADWGCRPQAPLPTVSQLARIYSGPIAFVSMFSARSHIAEVELSHQVIHALRYRYNRTTVAIRSRAYVKLLQHEGAHKNVTNEYKNQTTPGYCVGGGPRRSPQSMSAHRCVGRQGGMPDMVAWDVNEFVYHVIENQ